MKAKRKNPRRANVTELLIVSEYLKSNRQRITNEGITSHQVTEELNAKHGWDLSVSTILTVAQSIGVEFPRQKALKKSGLPPVQDQLNTLAQLVHLALANIDVLELVPEEGRELLLAILDIDESAFEPSGHLPPDHRVVLW